MKKVAVVLSGCGVFDGSELQEVVIALLALNKLGASVQCFAPNIEQMHVVNHLTGEVNGNQSRNVLEEAARVTRGDVKSLDSLRVDQFDCLVVPGGFGVAKNLTNFAVAGDDCLVIQEVFDVAKAFAEVKKPAAYLCISPILIPRVYNAGVKLTIGSDPDTANQVKAMGGEHINCGVDDFVFDPDYRVLSTPAYMLGENIVEVAAGIDKTIAKLLSL